MQAYPYQLVNVFAESHFGGNPLAVFLKADGLNDGQMQAIAKQFNLSETVFVFTQVDLHRDKKAVADLRIFTPNYELPFAGHPTLGSAFVVRDVLNLGDEFILNTLAKPVQISMNGDYAKLQIHGYECIKNPITVNDLSDISGLCVQDMVDSGYFVNSGTQQLLIELTNREALKNIKIDMTKLNAMNTNHSLQATGIYYWFDEGEVIHSRMFFEQNGVMIEDGGTGSACANLGAYFIHHNQYPLNKTIHQGDDMGRPNRLILTVDDKQNICVGGKVAKVGWGEFLVS